MATIKSLEEKAKAYDWAIEQLRTMMPNWENLSYNSKTFLQDLVHIIPELKESEDERIRKAIHIYLDWLDGRKDYAPKGEYSIRDMIAWLEKQGEKEKFIKKELECIRGYRDEAIRRLNELERNLKGD